MVQNNVYPPKYVKKVVPHQIYKLNIYLLLKLDPFSEWLTGWILDQVSSGQVYGVIINCESPPKQHPRCGEILFFSKILCFLEKSLLSFREKSYFFEKNVISRKIPIFLRKRQYFLLIFPVCTQLTLWVILIYILLYNNCFLIATRCNSKEKNGPKREGFLWREPKPSKISTRRKKTKCSSRRDPSDEPTRSVVAVLRATL